MTFNNIRRRLQPLSSGYWGERAFSQLSYAHELFINYGDKNKKLLLKNLFPALGIVILPVLALVFLINIAVICLPWQDITYIAGINAGYFSIQLKKIYNLELVSRIFFILSIGIMSFFFFFLNLMIVRKTRN